MPGHSYSVQQFCCPQLTAHWAQTQGNASQLFLLVKNTWFVIIKIREYEMKTFLHHEMAVPEAEKNMEYYFKKKRIVGQLQVVHSRRSCG